MSTTSLVCDVSILPTYWLCGSMIYIDLYRSWCGSAVISGGPMRNGEMLRHRKRSVGGGWMRDLYQNRYIADIPI